MSTRPTGHLPFVLVEGAEVVICVAQELNQPELKKMDQRAQTGFSDGFIPKSCGKMTA